MVAVVALTRMTGVSVPLPDLMFITPVKPCAAGSDPSAPPSTMTGSLDASLDGGRMGVPLDMLPGGVGFLVTITDGLALDHPEAAEAAEAEGTEAEEEVAEAAAADGE